MNKHKPDRKPEQVKFWRDPVLANIELLRATYVTHSFSRHTHDSYAIGVIESGVEEFAYRGAVHQALAGDIVIVQPGEVHTGHAGVEAGWQYRMLYPDVQLVQRAAQAIAPHWRNLPYFAQPIIRDRELAMQLSQLHRSLEVHESQLERESRFLWTLSHLIARHAIDRPFPTPVLPERPQVQRVLAYLRSCYAEPIALSELSQIANLPPLRLLRAFQSQMGLPPHTYLIQLRVAQAKQLLSSGLPIAQVAADTGFTDQSHLNRHFKRLTGITPGQYAIGCRS